MHNPASGAVPVANHVPLRDMLSEHNSQLDGLTFFTNELADKTFGATIATDAQQLKEVPPQTIVEMIAHQRRLIERLGAALDRFQGRL